MAGSAIREGFEGFGFGAEFVDGADHSLLLLFLLPQDANFKADSGFLVLWSLVCRVAAVDR